MEARFLMQVLESIPEGQPVSLHHLTCKSGLDHRTIKKYLEVILKIQNCHKVVKEYVGMRVFVKKWHASSTDEAQNV